MAEIALRTYYEEIDGLIDGNRVEEAIAHLKHILAIYPKDLEAYRLLAKALLEKNRHLDAADVFQRVLSSVPDDFIAHIGMAVVREDEGNLDAAIWHMERAYEVQPSSLPIQEELRRLYGKRDGAEPPRLRLSRAALARMYEKGDLYLQAIGELRAALQDEPDRLDLKVLLASTLWRSKQRAEAAETSAKLLEILPYCKEANRILAQVWTESGQAREAQNYRRRLEALDPYEAFSDPGRNGRGASLVAAEQVVVPHLENVYGETTTDASRPDWMEALGIQYDQPAATEQPAADSGNWLGAVGGQAGTSQGAGGSSQGSDWLSTLRGQDQAPLASKSFADTSAPAPTPASADGSDDWLAGLGGSEVASAGQPQAEGVPGGTDWLADVFSSGGANVGAPATPSGQPDIPDWMLSESASESRPTSPPVADEPVAGLAGSAATGMTGWLSALGDEGESAPAPTAATTGSDSEVPDWLQTESASAEPAAPQADSDLPGDQPDWLKPIAPVEPVSLPVDDLGVPDWLKNQQPQAAASPQSEAESGVPAWLATESETTPGADVPDWLATAASEEPATSTPANELPAWLATGSAAEPPAAGTAEMPAWLGTSELVEPVATSASDLPDWLKAETPEADDAPAWLKAAPAEAAPAKAPGTGSTAAADVPSWLQAADSDSTPDASDIPAWLNSSTADEVSAVEAPDWLNAAASTAPAPAPADEELSGADKVVEMARADDEMPDWMKAAGWVPRDPSVPLDSATNMSDLEPAEEPEPEPAEALPDWLKALKPPEEPKPAPKAASDAPDWLRHAMEGEEGEAEPGAEPFAAEALPNAELPDWLKKAGGDPTDTVGKFLANKPAVPAPAQSANLPDWLASSEAAPIEERPISNAASRDTAEAVAQFLKEQDARPAPPAATPTTPAPAEMSEDQALAWLESLAAKQGASEDELVTKRSSDLPEWLRQPAEPNEGPTPQPEPAAATPAAGAGLPDWLQATAESEETPLSPASAATTQPEAMSEDEALSWLESLAAKQGANPEELVTKPTAAADTPAWLQTPEELVEALPEPEPGLPDWMPAAAEPVVEESPPTLSTAAPDAMSDDEALAWLESLAAKQGANPEELVTKAESQPGQSVEPQPAELPTPVFDSLPTEEPVFPPMEAVSAVPEPAAEMSADAALAWLESLAAKQGANPEELVTQPEARADETPAWIEQQAAAARLQETAVEPDQAVDSPDKPDWLKQMEAESDQYEALAQAKPVEPEPASTPEMSEDQALAWLESLAAKQGADPSELVTKPEARADETPAWIQEEAAAAQAAEPIAAPEPAADSLEKPDWLKQMEAESDEYEATAKSIPASADAVTEAALPDLPAWMAGRPTEDEFTEIAAPAAEAPDLPELPQWLSTQPTKPEPAVEPEPAWTPTKFEPGPAIEEPAAGELPAWLAQPVETESPTWVPMTEAPTSVAQAEAAAQPAAAAPPKRAKKKSPRKPRGRARPSKLRRSEEPEIVLALARQRLAEANLATAVEVYSELISSGHLSADVISDLEAAALKNPEQPELLRILGDAYMRDNQLQKALDAYKQALSHV